MDASNNARTRHIGKLASLYYFLHRIEPAFGPGFTTTSTPTPEIGHIARIMPLKSSDFRKSICLFAFCLGVVTYPKEPEREFSESGNSPDTECNREHIVGTFDRSRHMTTVFYFEHSLSQAVAVLFRTSDFSRDKWERLCFSTSGKDIFLAKYARGRWCFTT